LSYGYLWHKCIVLHKCTINCVTLYMLYHLCLAYALSHIFSDICGFQFISADYKANVSILIGIPIHMLSYHHSKGDNKTSKFNHNWHTALCFHQYFPSPTNIGWHMSIRGWFFVIYPWMLFPFNSLYMTETWIFISNAIGTANGSFSNISAALSQFQLAHELWRNHFCILYMITV